MPIATRITTDNLGPERTKCSICGSTAVWVKAKPLANRLFHDQYVCVARGCSSRNPLFKLQRLLKDIERRTLEDMGRIPAYDPRGVHLVKEAILVLADYVEQVDYEKRNHLLPPA